MPISVTCPGCHKRFSVSEKFAGQKGPCPQCKTVIEIPRLEDEVKVHVPQEFGPKDQTGRATLKPVEREETSLSGVQITLLLGGMVTIFVLALMLRTYDGEVPTWILGLGALVLAPPMVFVGYTFLRDSELEPYRGSSLWLRIAVCSAAYALLWAAYSWLPGLAFNLDQLELFHYLLLIPILVAAGAAAAAFTLDLDFGNAAIHCGLYALLTVGLRYVAGMPLE